MNKEIALKWAAALRSGKYKQGKNALKRKDESMCCLGVLCDLHDPTLWINKASFFKRNTKNGIEVVEYYPYGVTCEGGTLPKEIQDWAGMGSESGFIDSNTDIFVGNPVSLVSMNDGDSTFEQIAEAIERNWETL